MRNRRREGGRKNREGEEDEKERGSPSINLPSICKGFCGSVSTGGMRPKGEGRRIVCRERERERGLVEKER